MDSTKSAQKSWAKTLLWKRAEPLHKEAAILKEHKVAAKDQHKSHGHNIMLRQRNSKGSQRCSY